MITVTAASARRNVVSAVGGTIVVGALALGAGAARGAPVHLLHLPQGSGPDDPAAAAAAGAVPGSGVPIAAGCPEGTMPDDRACVRLPDAEEAPEAESNVNAHHDKRGRWIVYDQIPRRPERPADYDAYRYPVPCERDCVVSGYDLDRPDEVQRRGRRLRHVGHGAVDLIQKRGTPITNVALEHQVEDAEVVYVGALFGITVVTRHTLREGGQLRDYILLFGHLEATAPGLQVAGRLHEGDVVGLVGDSGSPELVHLHLEARRVREGVDVGKLSPNAMIANENSIVCDPRNILPLR